MRAKRANRFNAIVRHELHRAKGTLAIAALSTLGLTLTELTRPWPLKIIVDHVLLARPASPTLTPFGGPFEMSKTLAVVALASTIVLIALVRSALAYFQLSITLRIGSHLAYALRRELFAHLQRLSLSFHSRARSGELLTKVASDTGVVKDVFAELALTAGLHLLTIIGIFAIMWAVNWRLALVVVATFPLLLSSLLHLYRKGKASARRQRKREEALAARLGEVLAAVPLIQAFGRERYEEERFATESGEYLAESIRHARVEAVAARAVEIITAAGSCAVIVFGSLQVLEGRMTLGSILIFTSYLSSLYRPVRDLAKLSTRFSRAMASTQRIDEILRIEPDIHDHPRAIEAPRLAGEIVFRNVSFDYGDGKGVLGDVSFTIRPGQRVALLGASGAGKSTLVSLILRLYDPQQGSIYLDGVDIRHYRRESLRRQIGIVPQNSILFGATVRENIAYGKLDATMEEIVAAATAANAHQFILDLADGYGTVIGERGETLSGGQRQRIAIARALIRDAPILILDEPMTGLDIGSAAKVREALSRLMAGKTCLVITHDPRAAADADVLLVLEDGRIVERGRDRAGIASVLRTPARSDLPPLRPLSLR